MDTGATNHITRELQKLTMHETQFPFEKLHPNAGALLKKEILLLPSHLLGNDCVGVNNDDSILTNSSLVPHELSATGLNSATHGVEKGKKNSKNIE